MLYLTSGVCSFGQNEVLLHVICRSDIQRRRLHPPNDPACCDAYTHRSIEYHGEESTLLVHTA